MNWLAQMEAKRLVLSLREMLVRFDENVAANFLMQECVPYILEDDPDVARARHEQLQKVAHIVGDTDAYEGYYQTNGHERAFEEQYQQQPEEAHEYLHRVLFLREWVEAQSKRPMILDLACNDGWMAQNLSGLVTWYHGVDLNPGCIERAKGRKVPNATFQVGRAEDAGESRTLADERRRHYDAVIAYELVEHVKDPDAVLAAMASVCKPGGSLFVSTPLGACTGGDLPHWWVVEPAGHVRAFTPRTFAELLNRHGVCDGITVSNASQGQLMVARVTVPESTRRHTLSPKGFGAWDTADAR